MTSKVKLKQDRYHILKLPIQLLIKNDFNLTLTGDAEIPYLIAHDDSLFDAQLRKLITSDGEVLERNGINVRVPQVILIEAKKNRDREPHIRKCISEGFTCNGKHYSRFGKSSSQGKDGITLFVDDEYCNRLIEISKLGIEPDECVISKYESQRSLILSTCTLINDRLPNIVIVDEYTYMLPQQKIRYVEEGKVEIIDKVTGEPKTINQRTVKEGIRDIKISPWDGCGVHTHELSEMWSSIIGLDYTAIGYQIRLPFFKGFSVEAPFREYFKSIGVKKIKDVFGIEHKVDTIDCIWNVSMWKGYEIFKQKYGKAGWTEYLKQLELHDFKLGISKYSHHKKDFPLKARMNYQYLQCLDLWNQNYIDWFGQKPRLKYDILDKNNWGKMLNLADYSTNLYEQIIKGDKFSTLLFLGLVDANDIESAHCKYTQAVLINDVMLKDPAIKQFLYRKLKKAITQLKYGKTYASGFYHTIVGDIIGYLEYVAGMEPKGCLGAHEFYADTIPHGKALSFRSPLVCPSEVNDVNMVSNAVTQRWFSHFKDQDVTMINMHDLSLPQQGGADEDGDAVFLCYDPFLVDTRIDKTIIIDVDDKVSAKKQKYTQDAIVEYELNSRDNRIGEITHVATSIRNQYTTDPKWQQVNDDNVSLLRVYQGKEIDSVKTGVRWHLTKGLRRYLKRLPYFLLHNYPDRLKHYEKLVRLNANREEKLPLNAFHSPSPMNELCDYVCTWEKQHILWDGSCSNTQSLLIDNSLDLSNIDIICKIKYIVRCFLEEWRYVLCEKDTGDTNIDIDYLLVKYHKQLQQIIPNNETLLANYLIKTCYNTNQGNKHLAWYLYSDVILGNLKKNSPERRKTQIIEVPYSTAGAKEFLGKFYTMIEGDN